MTPSHLEVPRAASHSGRRDVAQEFQEFQGYEWLTCHYRDFQWVVEVSYNPNFSPAGRPREAGNPDAGHQRWWGEEHPSAFYQILSDPGPCEPAQTQKSWEFLEFHDPPEITIHWKDVCLKN